MNRTARQQKLSAAERKAKKRELVVLSKQLRYARTATERTALRAEILPRAARGEWLGAIYARAAIQLEDWETAGKAGDPPAPRLLVREGEARHRCKRRLHIQRIGEEPGGLHQEGEVPLPGGQPLVVG